MLLAAGARPQGTNALLRALDFNDHAAVQLLIDHGADVNEHNPDDVGGEAPAVIPVLHQAARRGCDARMITLLLDAGADPARRYQGVTAYSYARVFGHADLAQAIEARGQAHALSDVEQALAQAAAGQRAATKPLDLTHLPKAYQHLIRDLIALPDRLPQVRRLVALGLPFDQPDAMGLPPVQVAGWEGQAEAMGFLMGLGPDLSHVNHYGGGLVSTILHGADHAPSGPDRDPIACLKLALEAGLQIARADLAHVAHEDLRAFVQDWAQDNPAALI
jgi:ankyrin repeat protein